MFCLNNHNCSEKKCVTIFCRARKIFWLVVVPVGNCANWHLAVVLVIAVARGGKGTIPHPNIWKMWLFCALRVFFPNKIGLFG